MAYNPALMRAISAHGIDAGTTWIYGPGDAHATVEGAGYFTNGGSLGMKVNDVVIVIESAAGGTTVHSVTAVAAASQLPGFNPPGAATISAAQFT